MPERDDEPFLSRWSRRKQDVRAGKAVEEAPPTAEPGTAGSAQTAAGANARPRDADAQDARAPDGKPRMLTEEDFADVDFDLLDAGSDYQRFMGANVPDTIRTKALAKLWTSDPQFAGLDPWHDYHVDFTDAARAVPTGLATAYKVGRGFLSDEEVAAWENLGKPAPDLTDGSGKGADQKVASAQADPTEPEAAGGADAKSDAPIPAKPDAPTSDRAEADDASPFPAPSARRDKPVGA